MIFILGLKKLKFAELQTAKINKKKNGNQKSQIQTKGIYLFVLWNDSSALVSI